MHMTLTAIILAAGALPESMQAAFGRTFRGMHSSGEAYRAPAEPGTNLQHDPVAHPHRRTQPVEILRLLGLEHGGNRARVREANPFPGTVLHREGGIMLRLIAGGN